MVKVMLWGSLKTAVEGQNELHVEASNVKQMLNELGEKYPELKPALDRGVSVAIDGQIYRDAWFEPILADSEVYLLPKLEGG